VLFGNVVDNFASCTKKSGGFVCPPLHNMGRIYRCAHCGSPVSGCSHCVTAIRQMEGGQSSSLAVRPESLLSVHRLLSQAGSMGQFARPSKLVMPGDDCTLNIPDSIPRNPIGAWSSGLLVSPSPPGVCCGLRGVAGHSHNVAGLRDGRC